MDNILKIVEFGKIKTNGLGKYRHIKLFDIGNKKTVDYVIFDSNKHYFLWDATINNELELPFPGRIMTITLTKDLINKVNYEKENINYEEGQKMNIIIWDEYGGTPEDKIILGLRDQLWRLKN